MTTDHRRLPCGCEWLDAGAVYHVNRCAEAERLYARTEWPFLQGLGTGDYTDYERVAAEYTAHFDQEVKP